MYYEIIKLDNWQDLIKLRDKGEKRAKENYKKDQFNGYTTEFFAIFGLDAIKRFEEEYGFKFKNFQPDFKTDGKTSAKMIPYLVGEWYYDARNGGHGGLADVYDHSTIYNLIEFDGVLLNPGFHRKAGETADFTLFNDSSIYREYLPYNYEQTHPTPQRVGTLTDKKLSQWKEWLLERKRVYDGIKNQNKDNADSFLNQVRSIDSSKCTEYDVQETRGRIVRNGIQFSYQISNRNIVSTKLEVCVDVRLHCKSNLDLLEAWGKIVEGKY